MDKDKPIKRRLETLLRYGFALPSGSIFKNKTGSVILQVAPNNGLGAIYNNTVVVLDGIRVGHYSPSSGDFVYGGGKALEEAFPESKIKSVFTNLLRQYLNKEKDEYEDEHLGVKQHLAYNPLLLPLAALKALGIFDVPKTLWALKFFEVETTASTKTITVRKKTTQELLFVLELDGLTVHSKKITDDVLNGVLFYLLEALGKWWVDSGRIVKEPVVSEWLNPILGIRQITLDWLAWKGYGDSRQCRADQVTVNIRAGIGKVVSLLAKEHNESDRHYVAETPRDCEREFIVYRLTKQCVY